MRNPDTNKSPLQMREYLLNKTNKEKIISYDEVFDLINDYKICHAELTNTQEELLLLRKELAETKNRYADLFEFIPFAYFTFDHNGHIVEVNDAGANLFGLNRKQLLTRNFLRYTAPHYQAIFKEHCKTTVESTNLQTCELKLLRKNGPLFYAQLNSKSVNNVVTGDKNIISFIADISELKQKEEYLSVHHNKLAVLERNNSMGELASIIAHELNHPLSVISNFLHGSIRRLENGNPDLLAIANALKQACNQSHRIAEIVLRMKNFCCNGTIQKEWCDVNDIIEEAITFIKYENHELPLEIRYKAVKNFPKLKLDKIHIQQVILNLARNAIEAMSDMAIHDPRLVIEVTQLNAKVIEICVIDNGPGISAEHFHKLFNPYFTTKSYGIGLGLAVSRTIIMAHDGELTAEQNPFGGSCFKFTLPIDTDTPPKR